MVTARTAPSDLAVVASLATLAAALLAGMVLSEFWVYVLALALVYVLAALSLVVLTGWSGQLNLHVAALGLGWGAYAAFALVRAGAPTAIALALAPVVTVPFAVLVGMAAVRFRGLELAVATLAMGAIFERLFFRNIGKALAERGAGPSAFESSFVTMPRPRIWFVGFDGDKAFYFAMLASSLLLILVVVNLGRSGTGRVLRAVREREVMAETLGVPVVRYRIGVFAGSIALAAAAGGMFASLKLGITPDSYNLDLSFMLLSATVIGGIRSPAGAVIGGSLAALMPELVRFWPFKVFAGERLFVLFGAGMVLALWRLPGGLVDLASHRRTRTAADEPPTALAPHGGAQVERRRYRSRLERYARPTILRVDGARIAFGGVVALDGVEMAVHEGEICALIGPNGAGKSTLFNCVNGLLHPDDGRIYFRGRDVTEMAANRRAALGLGRTFQSIELFRELTVLQNLQVAGHLTRSAGSAAEALRLPSARRSEAALTARASEVASMLGLSEVVARRPGELPLGTLRVLELGMALVARPRMLLLDEPASGLDASETLALASLISRLREAYGLSVLLVEHDMSMVARLAEHVYVLDFGRVISQGTPEQVRADPLVLEKYLGEGHATPAAEPARRRRAHA